MKNIVFSAPFLLFLLLTSSCEEKVQVLPKQAVCLAANNYTEGSNVIFYPTVEPGEEIAATLGPVGNAFKVITIQTLFSGDEGGGAMRDVRLNVYEDNQETRPGKLLYSGIHSLSASPKIQDINVRNEGIDLPAGSYLRVSFETMDQRGFPTFAREFGGVFYEERNWLKESNGIWKKLDFEGAQGNWVIRAIVKEDVYLRN
jgi:hypothetical protein